MAAADRQHLPVPAFLRLQQQRAAEAARQPLGERCANLPPPKHLAAGKGGDSADTCRQQLSGAAAAAASSMQRRNQRERNRVKLLNLGFERLRQLVPCEEGQRLSKIATLRAAIAYIRSLQELLDEDAGCDGGSGGCADGCAGGCGDSCQYDAATEDDRMCGIGP